MDLAQLNAIARGQFKPTKKVADLKKDYKYMVTKVKQVSTRFGDKVVVEIDDEFQMFLPSKVSEALINNLDLLDSMGENANKYNLFLTYMGGNCIEFSNA